MKQAGCLGIYNGSVQWHGCHQTMDVHHVHQEHCMLLATRLKSKKKPTGQRKEVRRLFLLPLIAIVALQLLQYPNIHMGGPVYLQPIVRRARRRYVLPHHPKRKHKQAPGYNRHHHTWRSCLLLLYVAIFFTTPTAPTMITITHCYNTLPHNTSVVRPYNTRYNSDWVLRCGDVHPNPGHRRIYHLRRDCRLVPGPPVPLLDIEEYAQHLVDNTNRQYDNLDNAAEGHDWDMKLATWNIQGAQGTVSLQRWADVLHLI